jgi:hypothetical protein
MAELTAAQIDYLASQRLGRIATTGADGKPQLRHRVTASAG